MKGRGRRRRLSLIFLSAHLSARYIFFSPSECEASSSDRYSFKGDWVGHGAREDVVLCAPA